MSFGLRRRRPRSRRACRALAALLGVLAVTVAAAAAVVAANRHSSSNPTTGSGGSVAVWPATSAFPTGASGALDPDGDIGSLAPASDTPETPPPLPAAADLRAHGAPVLVAPPAVAGAHAVNVPILMYHFLRVDRNPADRLGIALSVTPADFALQLAYLKHAGYTTVSLAQVMSAMSAGARLPAKPIVLTFDDGFQNFATVGAPLLAEQGMTATAFVVSGFVGRPQYMTAAQVQGIVAMGMTVGAHTEHHVDLVREPLAVARQEIAGSRAALQALTGQPVLDFAYPAGQFDAQVVQLVQAAGFRDAVTEIPGIRLEAAQRFLLPRVRVFGGETLAEFARSIVGASPVVAVAAAAPAGVPAPTPLPVPQPDAAPPPRAF